MPSDLPPSFGVRIRPPEHCALISRDCLVPHRRHVLDDTQVDVASDMYDEIDWGAPVSE